MNLGYKIGLTRVELLPQRQDEVVLAVQLLLHHGRHEDLEPAAARQVLAFGHTWS